MFGPRSNQSPESMMFGSNKLERGIIFVTVCTLAVYTVVVEVVVVRHLSRGKCPFFCRRVLLIQRSASLRGQMIFGASYHLHSTKLS